MVICDTQNVNILQNTSYYLMFCVIDVAALVAFALHMDKTLHSDTPIRAYYILTVTG